MSGDPEPVMEPEANALAQTLHQLAADGQPVSDVRLFSPFMLSLAISAKRIADALERIAEHHTPPPGDPTGWSQHENNISDTLQDRFHDLAQNVRNTQ